ncbi:hypothetical protein DMUE_5809, partial [Dictyocoela muelleri]
KNRNCRGVLVTINDNFIREKDHNHDANYDVNEAEYLRFKCLERSINTSERDIIITEIGVASSSVLNNLPEPRNLIDKITRHRKKVNFVPINDDIPEIIKYTFSSEKFLIYDSGDSNNNRILIFSTNTHISYLEHSESWYCDGTFKSCPTGFEQVYTIMGLIKRKCVPLVYILMKDRSKVSYLEALNVINSYLKKHAKFITFDFEMAAFAAFSEIIKRSTLSCFFFHFTQYLFRKIQKNALMLNYNTNSNFRECFRMVLDLAYVPIESLESKIAKLNVFI